MSSCPDGDVVDVIKAAVDEGRGRRRLMEGGGQAGGGSSRQGAGLGRAWRHGNGDVFWGRAAGSMRLLYCLGSYAKKRSQDNIRLPSHSSFDPTWSVT